MRNIGIIGGSRGIGAEILKEQLKQNYCTNISRNAPEIENQNLTHYGLDIQTDDLPDLNSLDALVYCPGSITLKPISTLKEQHFLSDFQINVLGAVKAIKKYLPLLKKGENPSILSLEGS